MNARAPHRKASLSRTATIGITAIYNVVQALRDGTSLAPAEREVYAIAACDTLRGLHDELDGLVAEAYGWTWPEPGAVVLERLVALHDERVEEERQGQIRWLRESYQRHVFGDQYTESVDELDLTHVSVQVAEIDLIAWPVDAVGQITALRERAASRPVTLEQVMLRFAGAPRPIVVRHLETLVLLGEMQLSPDGTYGVAIGAA